MLNFTCAARPSSRESSTSVRFTPFAQSGYDSKSAMTARICSGGASITIDWVDSSAMPGRLQRCLVAAPQTPARPPGVGTLSLDFFEQGGDFVAALLEKMV